MEQDRYIDELIAKADAGTLTDEELRILVTWYNSFDDSRTVLPGAGHADVAQLKARIYQRLMERVNPKEHAVRSVWSRYMRLLPYAAASILVLAVVGVMYFSPDRNARLPHENVMVNDVAPGGNRAVLTLEDGSEVVLSEEQEGIRIGNELTYLDGSLVESQKPVDIAGNVTQQLVLSTPKGGTYQVTLPDGTQVWLNAASTLKYPSRFSGAARVVELVGEAYFEVTPVTVADAVDGKPGQLPFRVVSGGHEIEVLGTEFNIAAYPENTQITTTLVSGKVHVHAGEKTVALEPGQQSVADPSGIRRHQVEIASHIAWKKGLFHFQRTPLEEIMKQISRWYDVDVRYTEDIPLETFSGKVRRDVSLMGVLNILQLSTIDIKLQGRTLIVNEPGN